MGDAVGWVICSGPSCLRGANCAPDIDGFSVDHRLGDLVDDPPLSLDYRRLLAYFVLEVSARATSLLRDRSVILGPLKCHLERGEDLGRRRRCNRVLERLAGLPSNHVQFLFTTCNSSPLVRIGGHAF